MELPHLWQPASRLDVAGSLSAWFDTELGRELLVEKAKIDSELADVEVAYLQALEAYEIAGGQ